jgi:hypothetical protein
MLLGIAFIALGIVDQFVPRLMKWRAAKSATDGSAAAVPSNLWLAHVVGAVMIGIGIYLVLTA